ncbi:conserved hypothetical protein [Cenarchaeum symbiosum A]|uniref:Archease domain-containing protein n=1 Tax=Cenarchaeum symbiosum (strain A) TaxID=414004 RepID=A0RZ25_CENSY|nr:conserved hypothetical protein [Cenarchaeum symbiosum A]
MRLSYRILDHATDAIVEVRAGSLDEAFTAAGRAVAEITLDTGSVKEIEEREITASGEDLHYLLFNWLEEVIYQIITGGFAISRISAKISGDKRTVRASTFGEPIDLERHGFHVEIKAPTFHEMEIDESDGVRLRFLLDL